MYTVPSSPVPHHLSDEHRSDGDDALATDVARRAVTCPAVVRVAPWGKPLTVVVTSPRTGRQVKLRAADAERCVPGITGRVIDGSATFTPAELVQLNAAYMAERPYTRLTRRVPARAVGRSRARRGW